MCENSQKGLRLGFFSNLFGKKRRDRRTDVRLRVTIGTGDLAYWTEDLAPGGIRMNIGKQFSLGELTGGSRDVLISIEIEPDGEPVKVYGEPVWSVRTEDGQLSTGWMFSRYDGDGEQRLNDFISTVG
jgi:hypothetical protein